MSKVRVELNSAGVRELLQSPEMQAVLAEQASAIRSRCGEGYETDSYMTPGRAVASVYTATQDAIKDNAANNTLLKGLGG